MVWAAVSGVANKVTGGNYFSNGHPRGWSPLKFFGPWPWYVLICAPGLPFVFALMTGVWRQNR